MPAVRRTKEISISGASRTQGGAMPHHTACAYALLTCCACVVSGIAVEGPSLCILAPQHGAGPAPSGSKDTAGTPDADQAAVWLHDFDTAETLLGADHRLTAKTIRLNTPAATGEHDRLRRLGAALADGAYPPDEGGLPAAFASECDVAVGLGIGFPRTVVEQLATTRFYTLLPLDYAPDAGVQDTVARVAENYHALLCSYSAGAYVSGAVGALHAASLNMPSILVLTDRGAPPPKGSAPATPQALRTMQFIAGARAVLPEIVVSIKELDVSGGAADALPQKAFDATTEGVDLVYFSISDPRGAPLVSHVLEMVRQKREMHYSATFIVDPMTPIASASDEKRLEKAFTRSSLNATGLLSSTALSGVAALLRPAGPDAASTPCSEPRCAARDPSSWHFAPAPGADPLEHYGMRAAPPPPAGTLVTEAPAKSVPFFDDFFMGSCAGGGKSSGGGGGSGGITRVEAIERVEAAVAASGGETGTAALRVAVQGIATPCLPKKEGTVRLVGIGVFVNNVGAVDLASGSVYIDARIYVHQYRAKFGSVDEAEAEKESPSGACSDRGFRENNWVSYSRDNKTGPAMSPRDFLNFASLGASRTIDPIYSETGGLAYLRIQGVHYFRPNLAQWPFDSQELQIVMEDLAASSSDTIPVVFCHMRGYSGVSPSARYFPGQDVALGGQGHAWKTRTFYHCWPSLKYPLRFAMGQCDKEDVEVDSRNDPVVDDMSEGGLDESLLGSDSDSLSTSPAPLPRKRGRASQFEPVRWSRARLKTADLSCTCLGGARASSRLVWEIQFTRPVFATFVMVFLPPLTIMVVSEGAWLIRPASYTKRLGICGSSLVAAVLFHASLANQMPPTSQPTTADAFMLLIYMSIFIAYIGIYLQSSCVQMGYHDLALDLFYFCRLWGPGSTLLTLIASGWVILNVTHHRMLGFLLCALGVRVAAFALIWRYRSAYGGAADGRGPVGLAHAAICSLRLSSKLAAFEKSLTDTGDPPIPESPCSEGSRGAEEDGDDDDDEDEGEECEAEDSPFIRGAARQQRAVHPLELRRGGEATHRSSSSSSSSLSSRGSRVLSGLIGRRLRRHQHVD